MVLKPHSQFKIVSILYIKSKALDLRAMTELLLLLSFRGSTGLKLVRATPKLVKVIELFARDVVPGLGVSPLRLNKVYLRRLRGYFILLNDGRQKAA